MQRPEESYDRQVGLRIKQARIGARLTQKELASLIEVKQGTVSKLELGLLELKPVLMRRISEATGYPRAFFYEDTPVMPSDQGDRPSPIIPALSPAFTFALRHGTSRQVIRKLAA